MKLTSITNKDLSNKIIDKNNNEEINIIRHDLFKMRFSKVKKEGFSSSKYRQKRKALARLLTIENINKNIKNK